MSDEQQATETMTEATTTDTAATPAEAKNTERGPVPYDRFHEVNKELAALRKWRQDQEKAAGKAESERLAKMGEWEALAKQHEAAAQGLTAERDTLTARLAEAEAAVEATYQARLKTLPKEAKNAIESLPGLSVPQRLAWLDANAGLFARPTPPDINATAQGTGARVRTDEEAAELAAIYGVRAEYLKR